MAGFILMKGKMHPERLRLPNLHSLHVVIALPTNFAFSEFPVYSLIQRCTNRY